MNNSQPTSRCILSMVVTDLNVLIIAVNPDDITTLNNYASLLLNTKKDPDSAAKVDV